ncbi:Ff.00g099410.m01.CDS01 [Fusarium sp. VM40]|nr:Ff.00g099410.m01.CDS01 [Fusarium sp. VM40]
MTTAMASKSPAIDIPDVSEDEEETLIYLETTSAPKTQKLIKRATDIDCWSMNLDAFILTKHIFSKEHFTAPVNRPDNSSFLSGKFSAPDAIPNVDIDGAYAWYSNSRIADITQTPEVIENKNNYGRIIRNERLGVYLHWTLPQHFCNRKTKDTDDEKAGDVAQTHVPDRWMVFICITEASEAGAPALAAFIVESNRIRHFGGHFDPSTDGTFDVETEASPFIDKKVSVEKQVDVFMGMRRNFDDDWNDPDPNGLYHSLLTLKDSANPLFADFQHHNSNIFSIHDDVSWKDSAGKIIRPASATISYAVFGYHSSFHSGHDEKKSIPHGAMYNVRWTRDEAPKNSEAINIARNVSGSQPIAMGSDSLEALEAYLHSLPEDTTVGEKTTANQNQEPKRWSNNDWIALIDEMKMAIGQSGQGGLLDSHVPQNLRAGFKPTDGGKKWRFNNENVSAQGNDESINPSKMQDLHVPTEKEMKALLKADRFQAYIDALDRQEGYLRHRLFCEWWKRRAHVLGGRWRDPLVRAECNRRIQDDLAALKVVEELRQRYNQSNVPADLETMHATARSEFFSRTSPSIVMGGLGTAWPSEFLVKENNKARPLSSLPFTGKQGAELVQQWLKELVGAKSGDANHQLCMVHGMKLFFHNPELVKKIIDGEKSNRGLMRLPALFESLDSLNALNYTAPGWVRVGVDALMQEWAYALSIGNPEKMKEPRPAYYNKVDTHWNDTQPCRVLFLEWEVEYHHLPKRFWTLQRLSDGTADYRIAPGVNISSFDMMDLHKRTVSGRSILRPNAEWAMTTLAQQLLDKLDNESLEKAGLAGGKTQILAQLEKALKSLNLVSGNLDGFTDQLLTLHGGIHVSPYESETHPPRNDKEKSLLNALLGSENGQDVTQFGEDVCSIDKAESDFKPVTHGQARFTKFNIVDKFGQVVSPIHTPDIINTTKPLYPCLGRTIACQPNEAEGGGFANSVELDKEHCSQFFQLGHRINQDARLNAQFVVNSTDVDVHHETTQFFRGDFELGRGQRHHVWRPTSEYEDPVWGWLMLDFRTMGIQVYNAAGESMGEALVPDNIHGKAYWQVHYAEGDMSEAAVESSQLQQLMRRMSDAKFLVGLWAMLSDACQNIYNDPLTGDAQMLNMVGRPLALVNIGMNLELATPVMQAQSYQDLLKKEEIKLDEYKFEILLGDKSNLRDALIGYFPPSPEPSAPIEPAPIPRPQDRVTDKVPDINCVYTEFGYPGRNIVAGDNQKPDSFASPSSSKVLQHSCRLPSRYLNHPSTVVLGAIVNPYQPVHIATGILPSTTLKLPQWIIDQTIKKLRILLRGGPVLTRSDLPGIDTSLDSWKKPMNQTTAEACIPALTDKGEWSWLQPNLSAYTVPGDEDEYLPQFVPYNLKSASSDYPLEMGPHTVLEGFYKFELSQMKSKAELRLGNPAESSNVKQ